MTLPPVHASFRWTDESWGPALRCRPLEAVAPHLFSTRQLEWSSPEHASALATAVGAGELFAATQVHGCQAVVVTDEGRRPRAPSDADILVSSAAAAAIAVRAADCVPLLMADRFRGVVAAVHAGWRGTAARAATAAVEVLGLEFGSRPADIVVAIGPCIGGCCYEVGSELVDAFAAAGHERHLIDRWFLARPPDRATGARPALRLDLARANRDQLVLAGVPDDQVHAADLCTAMHLDVLTSYRAEGEEAGRLAGVIRRR